MTNLPEENFEILIKILRICGLWPDKSSWKYEKVYAFGMQFLFLYSSFVFYFISIVKSDNLENLFEVLRYFLMYYLTIVKAYNLTYNFSKILKLFALIKELMDFSESDQKSFVQMQVMKSRRVFKTFFLIGVVSVVIGLSQPFFTKKLVLKMWLPFVPSSEVKFLSTAFFHLLTSLHNSCISVTMDIFPIFFMSYVIGFIEDLNNELSQNKNQKSLKKCIKVQVKIKEIVSKFEETFSIVLLVQGATSVMMLCVISFSMTIVR